MSQQTSKEYLAAIENANKALAAAKEWVNDANDARKGNVSAVNFWNQKLATASPEQKSFIQNELRKANRDLAATDIRLNQYKNEVETISNRIQILEEEAKKGASAPNNSANLPSPGNLSAQDATAYPAPTPYPNESASGPQTVNSTENNLSVTSAADSRINSTNAPLVNEPARPSTPAEIEMRRVSDVWAEDAAQRTEQFRLKEALIAKGMSPAEAYSVAKNQIPDLNTTDLIIRAASPNQVINDEKQVIREMEFFSDSQEFFANINGGTTRARNSGNNTAAAITKAKDLRFRISLASQAQYFYKTATTSDILYPLKQTDGVIFPYTPQINLNYTANYESTDPTHSNYRIYSYKNSLVDSITIIGDFTAQDTNEANYLLAVIHFFKSVTKMFYGRDSNPSRGTPPPLCYLSGYGTYAFDMHPVVISTFSLSYPNDVNYINAGAQPIQGQQLTEYKKPTFKEQTGILARLAGLKRTGVAPGGVTSKNPFVSVSNFAGITRVPTKMTITITALPIITRNNMSNYFSLEKYASGELLKNSRGYGGTW